jgi:hypothetical protein
MKGRELRKQLQIEVERWAAKSFEELSVGKYPLVMDHGAPNDPDYYQTEVTLLERTYEYVHLAIALSNHGWRAFFPVSDDVLVWRKGTRTA